MRIGIDIRCLAEGKRTGVEEYTLALLKELFLRDTENDYVLFFNAWRSVRPDFSWLKQYPNVTLRTFSFPNKLLNLSLWYFGFPRVDRLIGGVDVFFLPNLNFIAVSKEVRLVVTAHDLSFELFPETFSWKQRLWHYLVNFRRLVRRADTVIAVSASTRDDLVAEYQLPKERMVVIPSGIDARYRRLDRNDGELIRVKEKYHLPYKFILFLGTFEPRKNLAAVLSAYETLQASGGDQAGKYSLVLAGTSGWKCHDIFTRIEQSPCREKIRLPGFIADEDKVALYNLASVFVYPSLYEGFGFPPLEALACGVPVVTSHGSALPQVVGDAALMVDPYQPDELFQALRILLHDQELSQVFISRGMSRASGFSWETTAKRTQEVLTSV